MSVPDEGYFRNTSYVINVISTGVFFAHDSYLVVKDINKTKIQYPIALYFILYFCFGFISVDLDMHLSFLLVNRSLFLHSYFTKGKPNVNSVVFGLTPTGIKYALPHLKPIR